ncbi:proline racemase family protein [Aquisalibacillus elongatus]|uniref:Proline racemase n=1 Tax=Aquisalibacillus elongatus TaxID=485577 RepID=A0A3N5B3F3_9BACI|nr:proline racemase family protein [Aquisalibacillus elongatus]RPF52186.1 proline racemase [Aquisalibacillus elongatus]
MNFNKLFTTIDTHTGGNPTRTVIHGMPPVQGKTMSEKMLYIKENMDWVRKFLMNEPRGHDVMSGAILLDPCHPEADIGVVYIETGGYLPMCGHDTIGCCTALIEAGVVDVKEPFTHMKLDTPAGLVDVKVKVIEGKAKEVSFSNVPSFLLKTIETNVEGIGDITCEVAYGGNFYGIIEADQLNLELETHNATQIIDTAIQIRNHINQNYEVIHPEHPFINGLTHIEFSTKPKHPEATLKNTVVVPPGGIDRSPCGTGTSAKLATLYEKGLVGEDEDFIHESIVGSLFKAKVEEETVLSGYKAVTSEITGSAWVMGFHKFFYQESDPLKEGFLLIPPMDGH